MPQAQLQEEQIPTGGIADFVMSDDEIAALEAEEAREAFGDSGIARFESIARRMASYGRYGDDTVAHVQKGELVVPRALIDQSPQLKASIFNHLRELGIEDPERYVVGSMENSINPETGMPEFFFKRLRRNVSNIVKGVKGAISNVGKILKKVAPVVLPIVLTPILGPIYAGAIGSGIGSLLNGGSLKDAVKAAAVGGVTGAVYAGSTGKGTFFENIKAAAANPSGRFSQLNSAINESASTRSFNPLRQGYQPTGSQIADDIAAGRAGAGEAEAQALQRQQLAQTTGTEITPGQTRQAAEAELYAQSYPTSTAQVQAGGAGSTQLQAPTAYKPKGFFESIQEGNFKEAFLPTGPDAAQVAQAQGQAYKTASQSALSGGAIPAAAEKAGLAAMEKVTASSVGPSLLRSYGPMAAAGTALAAGAGFFETPPEEENPLAEEFQQTGADLIAQSPEQFMLAGRDPRYSQGQYVVGSQYGMVPEQMLFNNPFMRYQDPQMQASPMRAAAGGEVYPRRNGGIMPNEGIPNQDSVRALLMPGEFVMTTNAVKGLGGGSMDRGINNMYSLMRNLETRGRAA
jgi:hypothetical protein